LAVSGDALRAQGEEGCRVRTAYVVIADPTHKARSTISITRRGDEMRRPKEFSYFKMMG